MTCLTRVCSSSPYIDKSLPWPDRPNPPCGISATKGMWALIQTQPKSRALEARIARPWSRVQTLDAKPNCLHGVLHLTIEGELRVLGGGDSTTFRAQSLHEWHNPSDSEAQVLWVVTPPIRQSLRSPEG